MRMYTKDLRFYQVTCVITDHFYNSSFLNGGYNYINNCNNIIILLCPFINHRYYLFSDECLIVIKYQYNREE